MTKREASNLTVAIYKEANARKCAELAAVNNTIKVLYAELRRHVEHRHEISRTILVTALGIQAHERDAKKGIKR